MKDKRTRKDRDLDKQTERLVEATKDLHANDTPESRWKLARLIVIESELHRLQWFIPRLADEISSVAMRDTPAAKAYLGKLDRQMEVVDERYHRLSRERDKLLSETVHRISQSLPG